MLRLVCLSDLYCQRVILHETARYCEDGAIEIDNNPAERSLRGVALGRRTICLQDLIPVGNGRQRSTA